MAQWLRALATTLPKDPSLKHPQNCSLVGDPVPSSGPLEHCMYAKHMHIKKITCHRVPSVIKKKK